MMARLKRAIKNAATCAEAAEAEAKARTGLPAPGDLYVLAADRIAIEWLIIREHPDDPQLLLVAPVDDFPLAARCDVVLPGRRPLTARCGHTDWVRIETFKPDLRVGIVTPEALKRTRKMLADLARGQLPKPDPTKDQIYADQEYRNWISQIDNARWNNWSRLDNQPKE